MRLFLRPFLGQYDNLTCRNIYPFCPWRWRALVLLSNRSLALQATPFANEACETKIVPMEERKVEGRKTWKSFFARFTAISQVLTCHLCAWGPCVGVSWAMALIGDAKQAMGEGKSGPVETKLFGPVATALVLVQMYPKMAEVVPFQLLRVFGSPLYPDSKISVLAWEHKWNPSRMCRILHSSTTSILLKFKEESAWDKCSSGYLQSLLWLHQLLADSSMQHRWIHVSVSTGP